MTRIHRAALTAFVLVLALAGSLHAVGEGRLVGTVQDGQAKGITGAKVVLTLAGVSSYKQEKTTDKNGKFTLLILDATKEYELRIEKEGFDPYVEKVKPLIGETQRITFTLGQTIEEVVPPSAEELAKAKEMETNNAAITAYNEGVALVKANDIAGAAVKFEAALKVNPDLIEAHAVLADIYVDQKKYKEALAAAERVLQARPNDKPALTARYDAATALGDKATAAAAMKALSAVAPGPEAAVRLLNEGVDHYNGGRIPQAIEIFEQAVKLDPNMAKAHYMLGLSYANADQKDKARTHLLKFLELAPNDKDAATAKEMLEYVKQ